MIEYGRPTLIHMYGDSVPTPSSDHEQEQEHERMHRTIEWKRPELGFGLGLLPKCPPPPTQRKFKYITLVSSRVWTSG
jgi:hypothetical protein